MKNPLLCYSIISQQTYDLNIWVVALTYVSLKVVRHMDHDWLIEDVLHEPTFLWFLLFLLLVLFVKGSIVVNLALSCSIHRNTQLKLYIIHVYLFVCVCIRLIFDPISWNEFFGLIVSTFISHWNTQKICLKNYVNRFPQLHTFAPCISILFFFCNKNSN